MLTINFEFVGGPRDGETLQGNVGEGSDAERYFLLSNWGAVGQRFKVASAYAVETLSNERLQNERRHFFQRHYYIVTDHLEDTTEVWVRVAYVPQPATAGSQESI